MTHPAQGVPAPVVHLPHNVELPIIFYQGQPVITLAMMDKAHCRPEGTARRNFNTNKDKLINGEDYFQVCVDEIRLHKILPISPKAHEAITLLTETGYLMLVKSFTDELAWQIQRQLVKSYFCFQKELPAHRITHAQHRELVSLVHTLSHCFAYQYSASHAAWQVARSICGTRATEMSADHYPAVLTAFQQLDKRARQFLRLREDFEARDQVGVRPSRGHSP